MPNPTGRTVLPLTLVSAALPILMMEDFVWRPKWKGIEAIDSAALPNATGENNVLWLQSGSRQGIFIW